MKMMTHSKQWMYVLAVVLGCTWPAMAYDDEVKFDNVTEPTTSIVRLASTSSWNADPEATPTPPATPTPFTDDPVQTPTQPAAGNAAGTLDGANCGGDSCCCAPEYSWIASAEATFFWPQLNRHFLNSSADSGAGPVNYRSDSSLGSVDGSLLVAPRIALGIQGCKWGIVGRYWYASNWATGYTPNDPALHPAGVIAFDGFRAYTIDLEAQRRFYVGEWTMYGVFGGRYAMVDNDRSLVASSLDGVVSSTSSAFTSQQFGGAGITFRHWGIRPICCDSPLKYFFANRYSFLWGQGGAAAQTGATVTDGGSGFATSANGALASPDRGELFICELQLGLQWDAQLKCFPGRAFVRGALEFQHWGSTAGAHVSANSFATAGPGSASSSASAGDLNFNLVGFTLGTGITY